jgi:hypothetical protein
LSLRIGSEKGVLGLVTGIVAVYFEVLSIRRAQQSPMMSEMAILQQLESDLCESY